MYFDFSLYLMLFFPCDLQTWNNPGTNPVESWGYWELFDEEIVGAQELGITTMEMWGKSTEVSCLYILSVDRLSNMKTSTSHHSLIVFILRLSYQSLHWLLVG